MKSYLYTGGGDLGKTSLVGGERVEKTCTRLDAYGTLDEFSSFLGVVLSSPDCPQELKQQLLLIQNSLFDLGAYLATNPAEDTPHPQNCPAVCETEIKRLEGWIDALDEQTPKIRAFVLPGGCLLAAHCHVARAVCRRAERNICRLAQESYVDPNVLIWINRLSDYLFIAARWINSFSGNEEIVWNKFS